MGEKKHYSSRSHRSKAEIYYRNLLRKAEMECRRKVEEVFGGPFLTAAERRKERACVVNRSISA